MKGERAWLVKLAKLRGQTMELRDETRSLYDAIGAVRQGHASQLPILMDMVEDWALRLGDYLTWLVNLEDYLKS